MNQDNNLNSQGNNGISNNQLLNDQGFNRNMVNMNTFDNKDLSINSGVAQSNINLNNNMNGNQLNNNKSKKGIIILIIGVLVVLGIILLIINPFSKKEEEDTRKLIENSYTMYVKINPLVKLNVKEKYYECKNEESGKFEKCSDVTDEVVSYNLVNNDAKEIYKELDLKAKNVVAALVALYDTARENEIEFTDIEITTNWDNRYSKVELVDAIKRQSKYSNEFNIVLDVEKGSITTSTILDKYGIEEDVEIKYTVVFNSDGGSAVPEQEVKKNEKVVKPSDPTRSGYNFVEWQLNGTTYDFDSEIKSDIELKAKWKQIVVKEETPKQEETPKEEPKQESTLDKINLNDNIYVYASMFGSACGDYIFASNVESVFGENVDTSYSEKGNLWKDNIEAFDEKYNMLTFDEQKEQQVNNSLSNFSGQFPAGIKYLEYENVNHMFSYSMDLLFIDDETGKFTTLSNQLNNSTEQFMNKVKKLFVDSYFVGYQGCGFGGSDSVILTEQLCTEYHLTCDRW